jgi:hypothetical protein
VKNRFQSLPFKCNLQRYTVAVSLSLSPLRVRVSPAQVAALAYVAAAFDRSVGPDAATSSPRHPHALSLAVDDNGDVSLADSVMSVSTVASEEWWGAVQVK